MSPFVRRFAFLSCSFLLNTATTLYAIPKTVSGKVIHIVDGDTVEIMPDSLSAADSSVTVRLSEIDTPEISQSFGIQAKNALSEKILGQNVSVEYESVDLNGRIIGKVRLGDRWVNLEMVKDGFAWHYRQYSRDGALAAAEYRARAENSGLWADSYVVAPWDYRRGNKTSSASKDHSDKDISNRVTTSNSDTIGKNIPQIVAGLFLLPAFVIGLLLWRKQYKVDSQSPRLVLCEKRIKDVRSRAQSARERGFAAKNKMRVAKNKRNEASNRMAQAKAKKLQAKHRFRENSIGDANDR